MNSNGKSQDKTAAIRARLKFDSEQAFIEKYAPNISKSGIFIKTTKPRAVGTRVKFEFQIADGSPVLRGIGVVVWNRTESSDGKPPGMGLKFVGLDAKSKNTLERIVEFKKSTSNHLPSRFSDAPPRKPAADMSEPDNEIDEGASDSEEAAEEEAAEEEAAEEEAAEEEAAEEKPRKRKPRKKKPRKRKPKKRRPKKRNRRPLARIWKEQRGREGAGERPNPKTRV